MREGEPKMETPSLDALDAASYISLATFRRTGVAVETPVWFARDGDKLYVFSESGAGKVKRLRNDPRLRVASCSAFGKIRGNWMEGSGRRVTDPALIERAYAALRRKYGWQMILTDGLSGLSGRIHKRAILEISLAGLAG